MRRLLLVAVMCGAVSGAQAADMPDLPFLRGSFTDGLSRANVNWRGVYIGGQASYGAADMDLPIRPGLLTKLLNNVDLEAQFNISKWPAAGKAHSKPAALAALSATIFNGARPSSASRLNYTHGNFFGSNSRESVARVPVSGRQRVDATASSNARR